MDCIKRDDVSIAPMVNVRLFRFTCKEKQSDGDCKELTVYIPESVDPHYSMFTWPSAVVVAQYIWFNRNQFKGKNVIELGAGTALPGIVASFCGANVTLTDNAMVPKSFENCRRSCQTNNLDLKIVGIKWGQFNSDLISLTNINHIILSDCFYDPKDFEDILVTMAFILERNLDCKCIVGYQIRCTNWTISDLLTKWCLKSVNVSLNSFEANGDFLADSDLPGSHTIRLLEISSIKMKTQG